MARSIQEMSDKFKYIVSDDRLFYGVIIVLVAALSFGLGRLSVGDRAPLSTENKPIVLQHVASIPNALHVSTSSQEAAAPSSEEARMYVGSKNGTKYHLPWCGSASQIKEENKVFFASKEEAQRAGYTPAANCKGI
jgi:hypothetical protein